jgi:hypothetical protein
MLDDRDGRRARILRADRPALLALLRIRERVLKPGAAEHHRADANADARSVHHVKHVREARVRRTDELADTLARLSELEERVDDAALTQLVIDAREHDVIATPARAVGMDEIARHDEQADALHARRSARNLREHHVDDVVAHLVIAARDPHLRAAQSIRAVTMRLGDGRDVGE